MTCPYCKRKTEVVDKHCSLCGHRIYNPPIKKKKKVEEE